MKRHRSERRGQTLVEFALILPVFVLILVGIVDLGRAVYAYHTINNAAREGARQAIVDQTTAHIQERAAQQAAGLGIAESDIYVDFRLSSTPDAENSCDANIGEYTSVGCLAVVRVPYDYFAATPIISQLVGAIDMAGESRFRIETRCAEPTQPSCPIGD